MSLSTLCLRCGMCCDGSLFTHVPLRSDEVARLRAQALPLTERAVGSHSLPQPCAALSGLTCTIYGDRPEGCRRYHCQLATALSEKEVSLDEALAVVDEAHARVASVAAALGPDAGGTGPVLQRARRAELPEHGGPLSPEARAARERAEAWLDTHFRGRFGPRR